MSISDQHCIGRDQGSVYACRIDPKIGKGTARLPWPTYSSSAAAFAAAAPGPTILVNELKDRYRLRRAADIAPELTPIGPDSECRRA